VYTCKLIISHGQHGHDWFADFAWCLMHQRLRGLAACQACIGKNSHSSLLDGNGRNLNATTLNNYQKVTHWRTRGAVRSLARRSCAPVALRPAEVQPAAVAPPSAPCHGSLKLQPSPRRRWPPRMPPEALRLTLATTCGPAQTSSERRRSHVPQTPSVHSADGTPRCSRHQSCRCIRITSRALIMGVEEG